MIVEAGAFERAARAHEGEGRGCEDAARAFGFEQGGFAALSDGCSGGQESGLAAKALVLAASRAARESLPDPGSEPGFERWARQAQKAAGQALNLCGLPSEGSPATLLLAWVDATTGLARWACWGDGVVALARGGSLVGAWEGQSDLNMPAYPLYAFDDELWERFEDCGGSSAWRPLPGSQAGPLEMERAGRSWSGSAQLEEGDALILASDGVSAVDGVEPVDVLGALALAKGPGRFMERRAARALEGWIKSGCALGDDFGVAALRWGRRGDE